MRATWVYRSVPSGKDVGTEREWERKRKGGSNLSITKKLYSLLLTWHVMYCMFPLLLFLSSRWWVRFRWRCCGGEDRKEDGSSGVCGVVAVHSLNLDFEVDHRWWDWDTVSAYGHHHRQGPNSTHHASCFRVGRLLTFRKISCTSWGGGGGGVVGEPIGCLQVFIWEVEWCGFPHILYSAIACTIRSFNNTNTKKKERNVLVFLTVYLRTCWKTHEQMVMSVDSQPWWSA